MVVQEDGPFDVFGRLRGLVYRNPDRAGWVQRGFACVLCVSFWLAWPVCLLLAWQGWQGYVLSALGAAGAVLVVHKVAR
jgi:hypothetical protein